MGSLQDLSKTTSPILLSSLVGVPLFGNPSMIINGSERHASPKEISNTFWHTFYRTFLYKLFFTREITCSLLPLGTYHETHAHADAHSFYFFTFVFNRFVFQNLL